MSHHLGLLCSLIRPPLQRVPCGLVISLAPADLVVFQLFPAHRDHPQAIGNDLDPHQPNFSRPERSRKLHEEHLRELDVLLQLNDADHSDDRPAFCRVLGRRGQHCQQPHVRCKERVVRGLNVWQRDRVVHEGDGSTCYLADFSDQRVLGKGAVQDVRHAIRLEDLGILEQGGGYDGREPGELS